MSNEQQQREKYFNALFSSPDNKNVLNQIKTVLLRESHKPNKLYKYCNIDTAEKILKNGHIELRHPDNFNDPFDCLNNVGVWFAESKFNLPDEKRDLLKLWIQRIPTSLKPRAFSEIGDIRVSYCYAMSCFTTDHLNHLMWAHYADSHKGVCLEFDVGGILEDIHPCYYVDKMPVDCWRYYSPAMALIKGFPWVYENEWRYIKETIRPVMRVFGQYTSQVYNHVHKNLEENEQKQWSDVNTSLQTELTQTLAEECTLTLRPTRVYLGMDFKSGYTNIQSSVLCKSIISTARGLEIPISKCTADSSSFALKEFEPDSDVLDYLEGVTYNLDSRNLLQVFG